MTFNGSSFLATTVVMAPLLIMMLWTFSWRWAAAKTIMGVAFAAAALYFVQTMILDVPASQLAWFHFNPLVSIMLLLISFIAWIVLRYAATNFAQDVNGKRFLWWFNCTVFAVLCVVTSQNLVLLWLAWVAISLSFHELLMFYPTRARAVLAAHKKFILARVAEACLAVAFFLLWREHGSLNLDEILSHYPVNRLSAQEQAAAILIALAALIKCAQLPVHGWLIQVVESPTPVSALLHAGVINLGGFLLILFSPLFGQALIAQAIVIVVAGLSMLVAALVMMTRISIKVRLAWSTNAQMGLMLVECALGLYELALLHMLAHSCYKALAFLNSGEAVAEFLRAQHSTKRLPTLRGWFLASLVVLPAIALLVSLSGVSLLPLSPWLIVAAALTVFLTQLSAVGGRQQIVYSLSWCLLLLGTYWAFKTILAPVIPAHEHTYRVWFDVWILSLFAILLLGYFQLRYNPQSTSSHRLFIALNAGFYLDEWLTRLTLKLWPLPRTPNTTTMSHGAI